MSSVVSPEEIPTVFDLYTERNLEDDPQNEPFYPYSEALNKRVSIWRGVSFVRRRGPC
jgi:hypothetical protein